MHTSFVSGSFFLASYRPSAAQSCICIQRANQRCIHVSPPLLIFEKSRASITAIMTCLQRGLFERQCCRACRCLQCYVSCGVKTVLFLPITILHKANFTHYTSFHFFYSQARHSIKIVITFLITIPIAEGGMKPCGKEKDYFYFKK